MNAENKIGKKPYPADFRRVAFARNRPNPKMTRFAEVSIGIQIYSNMCKKTLLFTGSLTAILITGCGTDYRIHSVINTDKNYAITWEMGWNPWKAPRHFITEPGATYTYINPYTYNPAAMTNFADKQLPDLSKSLYFKASIFNKNSTEQAEQMYCRNQLQDAILTVIKEATERHLAQIKSVENNGNLLLGAATLGLSGGASVASGTAAQALAASAAGTAGARSLFNEQVFRQTFLESIVRLIKRSQEDYLNIIRERQINDIVHYTVEAAIRDAKEYESRGSFYHGLVLLQEASFQASIQNKTNKLN